jgi:hypothetical protein
MMTEKENFIQLKKDDVLRIGIKDQEGNDTGKYLVFDLEDIELPLRISECQELHKKNMEYLKNQFYIIDKKEDHKGKKLLSWKEEEKYKVIQKVYIEEMKALDLFLGEGKTQMILDLMDRKPYMSMYNDISEMIEPILPLIKVNMEAIKNKIEEKYKSLDSEVLK